MFSNMKKRKLYSQIIVLIGLFVIFSVSVSALDVRLNVTMSETVTQNVSFAKDFDLTEQQEYCMINGVINVTNPNNVTVFDTKLRFEEISKLTSDIYWVAGRNGSVISGGAGVTHTVSSNIGNNSNNYTLTTDLDNDGNYSDYMFHNGTHIVFNLSTEGIIYVNLSNSTTNPVSIVSVGTGVPLQMNEVDINGSSRVLGNLTITGTVQQDNLLNISDLTIVIKEHAESPIILHIPELRDGNYTTFNYNVTCMGGNPPVDVNTTYTNEDHPSINKKVLAGYNWTINQTVTNNNPGVTITNLNITLTAQKVTWNDTRQFNFSLELLYGVGDYTNVSGNGTFNDVWSWAPLGGSLAYGSSANISYVMRAPYSVPYSLTYLALTEQITYSGNYLLSNLSLKEINASADINFDFEKRITQPADNLNTSHNVTWEIRPYMSSPVNVSYNLNKVTLWVTHDLNPANYTGLNTTTFSGTSFPKEINLTSSSWWDPTAGYWKFNYTDGSSSSYPPPIVWMEPEWLIKNAYGQIVNSTYTVNGQDLYMKYIYVVNGYWLQIEKNITSINEDQYNIFTYVENIGNGWTPKYEKVTVYDFVPSEFAAWNWSVSAGQTQAVGTSGSDYEGTAYVWDIGWKLNMNSSLGPKNGPNATSWQYYSWNVSYVVNGSGPYRVSELYIIGLDPLKVDGAFASPIITVISGIKSYSNEILYIAIVVFLIVVNVINLVMTNKINRKINQRLPPAPAPKHNQNRHDWR